MVRMTGRDALLEIQDEQTGAIYRAVGALTSEMALQSMSFGTYFGRMKRGHFPCFVKTQK